MIERNETEIERSVLVGVISRNNTVEEIDEHLEELAFLVETAGGVALRKFVQKLDSPHQRYFIGSGKLDEVRTYCELKDIDTVVFDEELSPAQQRNLERELKRKIVDRTSLILDIFAQRAQTAQAKAQVELAQMQYLLPRLKGLWTHLERQRGGIGMRGPGEKEIETDRRIVQDRISSLKKQLEKLDLQNQTRRKTREQMIRVALVGYTNVGKSTLMNLLSKSDVFAENKLFATLDTTVRKVVIDRVPFLLSDTVGFIRKLPHHLVESFKSTLDEARESDIIAHVVDAGHDHFEEHISVVNQTLMELGAGEIPQLMIFNKMDLYRESNFDPYLDDTVKSELEGQFHRQMRLKYGHPCVFISAAKNEGTDEMRSRLVLLVQDMYAKRYPYQQGYHW